MTKPVVAQVCYEFIDKEARAEGGKEIRYIMLILMRRYCTFNQRRLLWRRFFLGETLENTARALYKGSHGTYHNNYTRALHNIRKGIHQREILLERLDEYVILAESLKPPMRKQLWKYVGENVLTTKISKSLRHKIYAAKLQRT